MYRLFFILPLILLAACSRQLETGLTEQDAQEIVVTLRENGIDATTKVEAGDKKGAAAWQVSVKGGNDKLITAWNILRENGLPREKDPGLADVFANGGMIPTASEEKAKLMVGLSGELARTLKSITGVVDARVNVVLPDNNPLLDKSQQNPPTASVLLRYRGNRAPLKEQEIQSLIAKGIEGLSPDGVSVVLKKVEDRPIPARTYGPLLANEWTVLIALCFSGTLGLGSLALIFVGRKRKLQIEKLKRQLADRTPVSASEPRAVRA